MVCAWQDDPKIHSHRAEVVLGLVILEANPESHAALDIEALCDGEKGLLPMGGWLVGGRAQPHTGAHLKLEPAQNTRKRAVFLDIELGLSPIAVEICWNDPQIEILDDAGGSDDPFLVD